MIKKLISEEMVSATCDELVALIELENKKYQE